jgi:hypothetical protein
MECSKRGKLILAIALCSMMAMAAGCGVATQSTGTHAAPHAGSKPTKAQYIAEADAICTRLNKELNSKEKHLNELIRLSRESKEKPESEAPVYREMRNIAGFWRSGASQLRALSIPAGDTAIVGKMEVDRDNIVADWENLVSAAENKDESGVERAKAAARSTEASYRGLEQGYGFKVCGLEEH